MRTPEERSGWAANTRIEGSEGVCGICRNFVVVSVLGGERNWLEITPEPIRRPMLDGQVRGKEKQGDEGGGSEEGTLPLSECFSMRGEGERKSVERFFITDEEGVFGGANQDTHGREGKMEGREKESG